MNINKEIERLESELPNVCCNIYNFNEDNITDQIHDLADDSVDIYSSGLLDWLSENRSDAVYYIEEAVGEFGIDYNNFDFWKLLSSGQYLMYERQVYDNLKDTLYLWCLHYLKEEKGIEELDDDKLEKIEDLDETDFYEFSELKDFVNEIITEE